MMPSSPTPKIPLWIFILTDVALLLAGLFIAARSSSPLSSTAVFAIVACVIAGAVVIFVPLVSHIEREKNEALDDRQRALEALASTVATAAEQISIAASGLHAIAELAQKNLRSAEQLPVVLQGKITEFQALLTNAQEDEREELKKELAQLRASETDRLEATADKVDHAAGELAKLEAAAQQHLTAAQAAFTQTSRALTAATTTALAEIEARLAARAAAVVSDPLPAAPADSAAAGAGVQIRPVVPPTTAPFSSHLISTVPLDTPEPPAPSEPPAPVAPVAPVPAVEAKPARPRAPRKPKPAEAPSPAPGPASAEPSAPPAASAEFSQNSPDETPGPVAEVVERVISSDGATRLLVTAYIGIGNRLFIRGEGPGLSWDKGVPLQFVSIGKWRWESADATAPVRFKLYKNDEMECKALGSLRLDPGTQQEVTATF